jgi:hypothetical protein
MKIIIVIIGILSSTICGFLFAGIIGSILFTSIITLTIYYLKKSRQKIFTNKAIVLTFISFGLLGYLLMNLGGIIGSDKDVIRKLDLIDNELKSKNYKTKWVIISQKRNVFINNLLPNSAKKSYHLKGIAIDIYVFDINGDNYFDIKDIKILEKANNNVEKKYPELKGAFGDYFINKNGYFTKHMIHIDTRGFKIRYTK